MIWSISQIIMEINLINKLYNTKKIELINSWGIVYSSFNVVWIRIL